MWNIKVHNLHNEHLFLRLLSFYIFNVKFRIYKKPLDTVNINLVLCLVCFLMLNATNHISVTKLSFK
jgi:hypothetical protein